MYKSLLSAFMLICKDNFHPMYIIETDLYSWWLDFVDNVSTTIPIDSFVDSSYTPNKKDKTNFKQI